ncbi:unnamed protein product [Haemonchus placei]|uniref:PK_Tyr_Ser-Thr domain-containing protein n=1 Tax=Haemonchus placei TaxID=6290 RepID=A0A0N4WND8_HAEPC|nr:unnamed protein product [Haemonchus placei]
MDRVNLSLVMEFIHGGELSDYLNDMSEQWEKEARFWNSNKVKSSRKKSRDCQIAEWREIWVDVTQLWTIPSKSISL